MNLNGYLFTVNKNASCKLSTDELADVLQDVNVFLSNKKYNNEMTRKAVLSYYRRAVNHKLKAEQVSADLAYLDQGTEVNIHEREQERIDSMSELNLNRIQKRIVELLIRGFDYKEVRSRLRLSESKLKHHVYNIRLQNTV